MKNRFFVLSLAGAMLLGSCSKEITTPQSGGNAPAGDFVSVTLPMQLAPAEVTPPSAMSKSATMDNSVEGFRVSFSEVTAGTTAVEATAVEATAATAAPSTRTIASELSNVWVLQFDSTGQNVSTTNTGTLAAGAYLTIPSLKVGTDYTICVVANGTASGLTTLNPATLTAFESTMLYKDAVTDAAKLPLCGKLTGVTVLNLGNGKGEIFLEAPSAVSVVMKRIQAEVALDVDFRVTGYTLTGAELYNVPLGAAYSWNTATTTFPDNAADFGYTTLTAPGLAPVTTSTSGSKTSFKWFIGDNRRGEVAGLTSQSDRNKTKAPAYATFARITIDGAEIIMYDVYLGSGSVTNFEVKRNMTYTQTAVIKGSAAFHEALPATDARVSSMLPIWITDTKADSPFGISPKSTEPISTMTWGALYIAIPGARDIFNGKANTDAIMGVSATKYPAAKHCRDIGGAEWNLPAQAQLMLMWIYLPAIPVADRPRNPLWSSTEISDRNSYAWGVWPSDYYMKGYSYYVRCVREL